MNVFKRIKSIVDSNINSLLDKAEDSEKMLKLMIGEMEEASIELNVSIEKAEKELECMEKSIRDSEKAVSRWQERAEMAVDKGSDDMAKEAIRERKREEEILALASSDRNDIKAEIDEMKKEKEILSAKTADAKEKLKTIPPKKEGVKAAKVEKKEKPAPSHTLRFEEMEKRITRLESYREIKAKTEEVKKDEKSIQEKMEELEIENELNDLKKAKGIA